MEDDDDYGMEDAEYWLRQSDEDEESSLEEGCVFPGQCCMPGPHFTSECHTAEMIRMQKGAARG